MRRLFCLWDVVRLARIDHRIRAGKPQGPPAAARPADGQAAGQTSSDPRVGEIESLGAVDKVRTDTAGRIRRIDFNRRLITDDTLARLRGLEHLDYLDLVEAYITDDGLQYLTDLPGLETLFLSSTAVTDAGLKHVSQVNSLKTLYLITTGITDEGLAHLTALENLEELFVGETRITDAGMPLAREAASAEGDRRFRDVDYRSGRPPNWSNSRSCARCTSIELRLRRRPSSRSAGRCPMRMSTTSRRRTNNELVG